MEDRSWEAAQPMAPGSGSLGRSRRVLIVEDDDDTRRLYAIILGGGGWTVDEAIDGEAGVDRALRGGHDLILMDIRLPGMSGRDAARRLRAAGARTPILAITADAMAGHRAQCLEAGCDAFVAKPIGAEELRAACEGLVIGARESEAA